MVRIATLGKLGCVGGNLAMETGWVACRPLLTRPQRSPHHVAWPLFGVALCYRTFTDHYAAILTTLYVYICVCVCVHACMHTYTYICVAGAVPRVNDSFSGVPKQNMGSPLTVSAGGGHVAIIDIEKRLFTWSQTNSSGTHA